MEEVNKKYKKILNDLLNITKNDSCIFSNVNNKTIFDVQKKFSDSLFNKIISERDFNLPLTQINNEYFINQILKCNSIEELISLYKAFNEEIPDELNNLLKKNDVSIEKVKHELIKSMEIPLSISSSMTINAIKVYPKEPTIANKNNIHERR